MFGDCIDTRLKLAGFIVGLVSFGLYVANQTPQMVQNYRNKRADGISLYLILLWLLGDSTNLVGTILTDGLPIQKIISVFFVTCDCIFLSQLFFYGSRMYREMRQREFPHSLAILLSQRLMGSEAPRPSDSSFCSAVGGFLLYILTRESVAATMAATTTPTPVSSFWDQVFADSADIVRHNRTYSASLQVNI